MRPIRVLIFDDNNDRRDSLAMLVASTGELELAGNYPDCRNALEAVGKEMPDVILMDIGMPGINGISATALIKKNFPDVHILIQTVFEDTEKIFRAITAGASGYLLKSSPAEKIVEAILEIHRGGSFLSPAVATKVLDHYRTAPAHSSNGSALNSLSDREREVLNLLVEGMSYKLIAGKLDISYFTVNTHIRKIYEKLQVHSSGEAVAKALQQGMVK